jgi:hypothetical protein
MRRQLFPKSPAGVVLVCATVFLKDQGVLGSAAHAVAYPTDESQAVARSVAEHLRRGPLPLLPSRR